MAIVAALVLGKALRASEVRWAIAVCRSPACTDVHRAAQMVNFPVASGTTGHLLGETLAAILLGLGRVADDAIVVVVQALVFADGGLTALGYNTVNMAVVPFAGWALFRGSVISSLATWAGSWVPALAAGVSVVLSAMAFSLQWLFGATAPVAFDTVFGAMVGVHVLIGVGEAVVTGLVVAAVSLTPRSRRGSRRPLDPARRPAWSQTVRLPLAPCSLRSCSPRPSASSPPATLSGCCGRLRRRLGPTIRRWPLRRLCHPRPQQRGAEPRRCRLGRGASHPHRRLRDGLGNADFDQHPRPDHEQLNSIRSRHLHVHGTSRFTGSHPNQTLGLLGFVVTVAITPRQSVSRSPLARPCSSAC